MSDIAIRRAEALSSLIFQEAERISRLLGKAAIKASSESWDLDEAMRFLRHAQAEWQITEGLARLAALNASYSDAARPTRNSRVGPSLRAVGANMAGGAMAVLALVGLSYGFDQIRPSIGEPYVVREDFPARTFDQEKLLQLLSVGAAVFPSLAPADAAQCFRGRTGEPRLDLLRSSTTAASR